MPPPIGSGRLAALLALTSLVAPLHAQSKKPQDATPRHAIIYPFVAATDPVPAVPTPSTAACPIPPAIAAPPIGAPPAVLIDPQLAAAITAELQKKLSKKFTATVAQPTTPNAPTPTPEPRTLLFAGCITAADPGNAAARYAGMGLGASHLNAHIVIQVQSTEGPHPLTDFDLKVTGSNLLPPLGPIGLVTHAVTARHKTLTADAKKLADEILKTFAEKMKAAKSKPA